MSNKKSKPKKSGKFLKVLILALVLTVVAVASIIISDIVRPDNPPKPEMETVTITVSGNDIYLNGNDIMSLDSLYNYLENRYANNDYCTIALINDTKTPADIDTYNDVVELLGDFGIKQEKLTLPEADNEMMFASSDEN
ncbi:MAG: hypothetical protein IKK10_03940 [Clostridia bacterium]|nr:hypothetical protein [Clostridia bacterium]